MAALPCCGLIPEVVRGRVEPHPADEPCRPLVKPGDFVIIETHAGPRRGTVLALRSAEPGENFVRIDVAAEEPGRAWRGCHPRHVRKEA